MASRKKDAKKKAGPEVKLTVEESHELGMVADRLSVQNPEGESLTTYLGTLRKAFDGRQHMVVELMDRLSRNPSEVGFKTYLAFQDMITDGKYRRVMKQVAYRFSQRGFSAEDPGAVAEKLVLIQKEIRNPAAHLIPVDGVFWLLSAFIPVESGYPLALTAYLDDELLNLSVRVTESSLKLYRDYLKDVSTHIGQKHCEIPMWHAAALFFEMLEFHRKPESAAEIDEARKLLEPYREEGRAPYVFELMPAIENPERRISEADVSALLKDIESRLRTLYLSKDDLAPYRERITELDNPVLVIPPEVQRERGWDEVRKAARNLCVGGVKTLYRRFFEEQAMYYKLTGRDDSAMLSWAIARHIDVAQDLADNPAVTHLTVLSMKLYWPEDFDDADRGRDEPEERTESGLIIP